MTDEARDWCLAGHIIDGCDNGLLRSRFTYLTSALTKINPRASSRTSWKALDVWSELAPSHQAPAVPTEMVCAIASLLVLIGHEAEGLAAILCFAGLFRASEVLGATLKDIIISNAQVVVLLGRPKRGTEQRVVLAHPFHSLASGFLDMEG